jgi:hypothetical protein
MKERERLSRANLNLKAMGIYDVMTRIDSMERKLCHRCI